MWDVIRDERGDRDRALRSKAVELSLPWVGERPVQVVENSGNSSIDDGIVAYMEWNVGGTWRKVDEGTIRERQAEGT